LYRIPLRRCITIRAYNEKIMRNLHWRETDPAP
jgi:hypothetical protein